MLREQIELHPPFMPYALIEGFKVLKETNEMRFFDGLQVAHYKNNTK
jgi:hypothetical protein